MARTKKYIRTPTTAAGDLRTFMNQELAKIQATLETLTQYIDTTEDPTVAVETGVWTPVLAGNTTAGVGTYTTQKGTYYKNGRLVVVSWHVSVSAHTGTGQLKIVGLPYISDNQGVAYSGLVLDSNSVVGGLTNPNTNEYFVYGGINAPGVHDCFGSLVYLAQS